MKQYKWQPGTSARIYYVLTVKDDGTMTLQFHGTDRSLTDEATVNADGWIVTKGGMFPPISCRKWMELETEAVTEETYLPTQSQSSPNADGLSPNDTSVVSANLAEHNVYLPTQSSLSPNAVVPSPDGMAALLTMYERQQQELDLLRQQNARLMAEREEQPTRYQRRQRRRTAQREQPSPVSTADSRRQSAGINAAADTAEANSSLFTLHSSLLKPLGLVAASVAACVVIYETGLLIPLGLIGLAAGGILK